MIDHNSRYYNLETATLKAADGSSVSYIKRRFISPRDNTALVVEEIVTEGDRLDLIAARTFDDSEQFWRICDANNAINPTELTKRVGKKLVIAGPAIGVNPDGIGTAQGE